jgi:hypothetical protein
LSGGDEVMTDETRRRRPARAALPALVLSALLVPLAARGQGAVSPPGPEQQVWLKNGGFLRGALVELAPGDHLTVQLVTGEIRRSPWSDVDRTSRSDAPPASGSAAPASSSAAPTASSSAVVPAARPLASSAPVASSAAPAALRGHANVRVLSETRGVALESRPKLEQSPWREVCRAPCGVPILVDGYEFRAAGEGITPSNPFRIDGEGTVRVAVRAGNVHRRSLGRTSLLIGLPTLLVGGTIAGIGYGTAVDGRETLQIVGIGTAIVGGLFALASLPLLVSSTTTVRTDKGDVIGALDGRRAPKNVWNVKSD